MHTIVGLFLVVLELKLFTPVINKLLDLLCFCIVSCQKIFKPINQESTKTKNQESRTIIISVMMMRIFYCQSGLIYWLDDARGSIQYYDTISDGGCYSIALRYGVFKTPISKRRDQVQSTTCINTRLQHYR